MFYSVALVVDVGGCLLYYYHRRLIIVPPFVVGIRCAGRLRVSYFYYFLCVDGGWRCGALDVLVPLFPSTSCCLVDGSLLVSLVEVLFTYWCRLVLFRRLFDRWHLMLCLTSFWEFGVPGSFVCNVALSLALRINY